MAWLKEQKPGLESVKETSSEKNSSEEVSARRRRAANEDCEAKTHVPNCRQIAGCLLGQHDQGRLHQLDDAGEEAPRIREELFCEGEASAGDEVVISDPRPVLGEALGGDDPQLSRAPLPATSCPLEYRRKFLINMFRVKDETFL